ncbi:MAG: TIGR04255 family protein [Limnobacter sp.]|uniref:TIGR04255 family protein n=1 Tax=Limnobacter sp. TaxID=2003368 RepID=UPI0032EB3C23
MSAPLKTPPVFFTLCQVRFNKLLTLADYLPKIQEAFRKAGYPAYSVNYMVVFQMIAGQSGNPENQPVPVTQETYHFGNLKKTHSFVLDAQKLTLQSTMYGCFEDFSSEFMKGMTILNDILDLSFFERIGLRYLDRVIPKYNDSIAQYLVDQVQGVLPVLKGEGIFTYAESMIQKDGVKLCARVLTQNGELAFPPDIQPVDMAIEPRFVAYRGISAVLDNDGFIEQREEFYLPAIETHLVKIHEVISQAFKATVTQYALEVWNT